jgi:putative transposase
MRCPRSLLPEERREVLALFHEDRFADLAPAQVYATLLDEGRYLCSERTMYRVLTANHEVRERRAQLMHPHYEAPELLATKPNQLWSWDITKLKGPTT